MSFIREANAEPLPGYRLIEPLGTGGFGEVWKCEAPGGLFKAIKFVYGNLNSVDGDSARAEQELGALNRVKEVHHTFILSLERIEVVEGELVIVMELADKSLHDYFVECQAAGMIGIPHDKLLRYMSDAAEALDHMIEKHNLQHLDIKPRNLFLIGDRVKVADFGLVKHLERQSGIMASVTPLYAPPETFVGQISPHSDQYSLAIVYQELLTGQRPFSGKNPRQLALQHTQEQPELRFLPEAERPVVARALAKDPEKRFPNCLAFVVALYNARKHEPIKIPAAPRDENRPKTSAESLEVIHLRQIAEEPEQDPIEALTSDEDAVDLAQTPLGMTMEQPQTGALRPTLVVGVGSFGRRALMELRCRFLDRFGDLSRIPMVQFLYVDADKESIRHAERGAPELAFGAGDAYHLPIQPVANYRRRMLDHLCEWIPREKLYNMPRSLQTQGSRALGRLAFADNNLRLMARLRRAVQEITHPDALYKTVTQTGLALRDNRPRVYVIAAAGGGGSGMLIDLAFGLRRLLHQQRHPNAEVTAMLFCGAPQDPATPKTEQANVYATLTELNHFTDPAIPFTAQYGADGPRLSDQSSPFHQVYLMQLAHRSPEAMRDTIAHLGSYLFHELTTPLGLHLDRFRKPNPGSTTTPFRSFGTYAVWFPRGLLLRQAGRRLCARLLEQWQQVDNFTVPAGIDATCNQAVNDPELQFEAICTRLRDEASRSFDGDLPGALTNLLSSLEEQSYQAVAQEDPASWARQALGRIKDWIGGGPGSSDGTGEWRKSRLSRALVAVIQKLAAEWDQRLSAVAFGLMNQPGARIAAAEAALNQFIQFCQDFCSAHAETLEQQQVKTRQAWDQMGLALEHCLMGGGFSWFGGRSRRSLRSFMDHLTAFSRQRLIEEVVSAALSFLSGLRAKLHDRTRELDFTRQSLRNLQHHLESPSDVAYDFDDTSVVTDTTSLHSPPASATTYWDNIRDTQTARVVLPGGKDNLDDAAAEFLRTLKRKQIEQLDTALQDRVLTGIGGLHHICQSTRDLARHLAAPLIDAAANCLGDLLPVTDVAQAEYGGTGARNGEFTNQLCGYHDRAAPLVAAKDGADQHSFLLAPASEAGKVFADDACRAIPRLELVRVPGQADLMFCREQGFLSAEEIQRIFRACRRAYEETAILPTTSPHARFDIVDWVPLDP